MPTLRLVSKNGQIVDLPLPPGTTLASLPPVAVGTLTYLKVPGTATSNAKDVNLAEVDDWTVIPDPAVPPPPPPPPPVISAGIAAVYHGDVGIEADPAVLWVERFDEASPAVMIGRYTSSLMLGGTFDTDIPLRSPAGSHSLSITPAVGSTDGQLYKRLVTPVDVLFTRYYVKYVSGAPDHSGVWMGGYNPPSDWPDPQAGSKPVGNERFIAAFDRNSAGGRLDHYNYWMAMHPDGNGSYWGNNLLNNPALTAPLGSWLCIEHMVKLNTIGAFDGEHAVWINGTKVSHLGLNFPRGRWGNKALGENTGIFTQDPTAATTFEGFQWRNDANLRLNWFWLQNYAASVLSTVKFAHLVAATKYIGPLA